MKILEVFDEDNKFLVPDLPDDAEDSDFKPTFPSVNSNNKPNATFRNITNIFDLPNIKKELATHNIVNVEILPKRHLNDNLYAMYIRTPYKGVNKDLSIDTRDGAKVALIVDYNNNGALALSRSGADKQQMLLISEIANKHIKNPFKLDKSIRNKLR